MNKIEEMEDLAMSYRRGGRSEKYQRDGEWGSFPADVVLELVEAVRAGREVTLLIFETDENEVRAAERFRSALARLEDIHKHS